MRTQHTVDTAALVTAARAGDPAAQDALVSACLPLVYNIVGRALNGSVDVDDVVQETMLRALGSLGDLRTPESFRSWLVAIAMNRVRAHWQDRQLAPDAVEETGDVADPGADFVDLTIVRLQLSGQRQETARATRWLEPEDREVLSLWWLECAGELTRAEVAAALAVSPQHTAVRVQRMKARLEAARVVVRALDARPGCGELRGMLASWDGRPSALWRKRIARHARECARCGGLWSGLLPAEGLLAGLALVAVSSALLTATRSAVPGLTAAASTAPLHEVTGTAGHGQADAGTAAGGQGPVQGTTGSAPDADGSDPSALAADSGTPQANPGAGGPGAGGSDSGGPVGLRASRRRGTGRGEARRRRRTRRRAVGGAVVAACVAGGGLWYFGTGSGPETREATTAHTADAPVVDLAEPSVTATSSPPSASASPSPSHSKKPHASRSPRPARTSSTPTARPSTPTTPRASRTPQAQSAPTGTVAQVVALVNKERAAAGCGPVTEDAQLDRAAQGHSDDMAARGFFDHTNPDGDGPGERITAAGYRWSTYGENIAKGQQTPQAVMDSWMNSPGHRANILNCSFKNIGVGVHNGSGGPWWTQAFGARL
ncbi:sigma-70 family RNA polymerase sigma factor [Streptomyces sp. Go40/10]|uniref:sigma-70 family RNA polymerase sigma factor n=1 Tax=Streptomyces sp. Go40/10 TaxID=2825844 RepID=UPI001E3D57C2|nr:sigma-70 family RNA polymerase sigma factor [Streptomyces sp. Go40/10]UFR06310.1 sigma-70 family RNA polymerase sigma factor [Streptomyces sp. Go40/10]